MAPEPKRTGNPENTENTLNIENIVVTGKSGAGKQPRIDVLVDAFGLRQLSTGDIFRRYLGTYGKVRHEVSDTGLWTDGVLADEATIRARLAPACQRLGVPVEDAALGFAAAQYVDRGRFVPDDITNALLDASFHEAGGRGLVLDGYPRTADQSEHLLELAASLGTRLDFILLVDNDDEAIVTRTVGRRICPSCKKVYHVEHKPPGPGDTCTACGATVVQRSDDTEDKIRMRLREFQDKALPAIGRLQEAGIPLARVPGNLPVFTPEKVRESVMQAISPLRLG